MKKLHLLILRSFISPFILTFFIVLFVLLMQFLWRYIDELVGKGLTIGVIGEFMLYTSASLVPMALPLAILMSSLMTFGNLGERYELTAIKASGVSLQRVMMPLIFVVFIISIGAFFFANEVLPYANLELRTLLYDIRQKRPELQIKPGEFYNGIEGYALRIGSKDPETNTLYNVKIYNHSQGRGNASVIIADSGTMVVTEDNSNLIFTMYDGFSYNEMQDHKVPLRRRKYPHRFDKFDEYKLVIKLTGFNLERTDQNLFKSNYSFMDLKNLSIKKDSLYQEMNKLQDRLSDNIVRVNLFKKRDYRNKSAKLSTSQMKRRIEQAARRDSMQRLFTPEINAPPPDFDTIQLSEKAETDTTERRIKILDLDSTYAVFTQKEMISIFANAQSLARTAKNYVDNTESSLESRTKQIRRFEIEWHRKFTVAFACLIFLFIGAPLGAVIRKGGLGLPMVLSILFFVLYYILSLTGEKLVRESILKDYQGMWMTSGVFLVAGVFITYQATTDSSILNFDTYSNYFKKIFGQRYNLVDILTNEPKAPSVSLAKKANINAALNSLIQDIDGQIITVNELFNFGDFLISVFTMQGITNLRLFERLYKNIMRSIINHPLFDNRRVRSKLLEFPDFNYKSYQDSGLMLIIKIFIAIIPIVNLVIIIRHRIMIGTLKNNLKHIRSLTEELKTTIQLAEES